MFNGYSNLYFCILACIFYYNFPLCPCGPGYTFKISYLFLLKSKSNPYISVLLFAAFCIKTSWRYQKEEGSDRKELDCVTYLL
jgi:hypothetical protein